MRPLRSGIVVSRGLPQYTHSHLTRAAGLHQTEGNELVSETDALKFTQKVAARNISRFFCVFDLTSCPRSGVNAMRTLDAKPLEIYYAISQWSCSVKSQWKELKFGDKQWYVLTAEVFIHQK